MVLVLLSSFEDLFATVHFKAEKMEKVESTTIFLVTFSSLSVTFHVSRGGLGIKNLLRGGRRMGVGVVRVGALYEE